ncbi:hypothetical protein [Novosphingobium profundi]|uniref:hypothetical protein n=1 Tax=Novosphingobium profundi TaxID=1774954 RepID=UPI001CFE5A69|nr:hypothetical protein [Novosphingobium profundi]
MPLSRYSNKISQSFDLETPNKAIIALTLSESRASKDSREAGVEDLQGTMNALVALTDRGFLGARSVSIDVTSPSANRTIVTITAENLPPDLVVIALRLTIDAHDTPPNAFNELLNALDGDREMALEAFAGIDFDSDVIHVDVRNNADAGSPMDALYYLGGQSGDMLEAARITLAGFADAMPDVETEHRILSLAQCRAFLPLGAEAGNEPGEEEYFASGQDLIIDTISIEVAALTAILAMQAPDKTPDLSQRD